MDEGERKTERMNQILASIESGEADPESYVEEIEELFPGIGMASLVAADDIEKRYQKGEIPLEEAEAAVRSYADKHPATPLLFFHCANYAASRGQEEESLGYMALYKRKLEQFEEYSDFGQRPDVNEFFKPVLTTFDENPETLEVWPYLDTCGNHLVNHFMLQDIIEYPDQMDDEELEKVLERREEIAPLLAAMLSNQAMLGVMGLCEPAQNLDALVSLTGVFQSPETLSSLLRAFELCAGNSLHEAVLACAKLGSLYPDEVSRALREIASDPGEGAARLAAIDTMGLLVKMPDNMDFLSGLLAGLRREDELFDDLFVFLSHALLSSGRPDAAEMVSSALRKHRESLDDGTVVFAEDYLKSYREIRFGARLEELLDETVRDFWPWPPADLFAECRRTLTLQREEGLAEEFLEDELDLSMVEQLLRTGRNQPCTCGSGIKFKKCCLPDLENLRERLGKEGAAAKAARETPFIMLMDDLEHFSRRPSIISERAKAMEEFMLPLGRERFEHELEPDIPNFEKVVFNEWFHANRPLDGSGRTVAEEFLATYGPEMPDEAVELLRALVGSRFSVYEVLEVYPGKGLLLRDIFRGEEVEVRERTASRELVKWDLLGVRVGRMEDHYGMMGAVLSINRKYMEAVEAFVGRESAKMIRKKKVKNLDEFLQRMGYLVFNQVIKLHDEEPMPTMVTAEGDLLTLCTAVFDVRDQAEAGRRISGHPYMEEEGETGAKGARRFIWHMSREMENELRAGEHLGTQNELRTLDRSPKGMTDDEYAGEGDKVVARSFGMLELKGKRLTLETQSRERLEAGKRALSELLSGIIAHRVDGIQDQEAMLGEAWRKRGRGGAESTGLSAKAPKIPPEVERKIIEEMLEKVYADWLDSPIPYLDGKTPREAAKTPEGQSSVDRLLKDYENKNEREKREGRPVYDFNRFREELDIRPDRE